MRLLICNCNDGYRLKILGFRIKVDFAAPTTKSRSAGCQLINQSQPAVKVTLAGMSKVA